MSSASFSQKKWSEIITPENNLFAFNFREIWNYRDLVLILIRRDILAIYKQTLLGPLWFFIQPLLTTFTYVIIFSRVAKFSTANLPPALFYLSGLVMWSYFSECILRTSVFFRDNSQILSKVYFPRLIIPFSLVLTNLIKFSIQFLLLILVYIWYLINDEVNAPNTVLLMLPVLIILIGALGLGCGIIVSSLTTKYKDLSHLLTFGVQLMMFVSPVILPLSSFETSRYKLLLMANPMTGIIEAFRYGLLGNGYLSWPLLAYDAGCILFILICGIVIFNAIEKDFVDSI